MTVVVVTMTATGIYVHVAMLKLYRLVCECGLTLLPLLCCSYSIRHHNGFHAKLGLCSVVVCVSLCAVGVPGSLDC